jgi:hypothetical protein
MEMQKEIIVCFGLLSCAVLLYFYLQHGRDSYYPRGYHWPADANRILSNDVLRANLGLPSMSMQNMSRQSSIQNMSRDEALRAYGVNVPVFSNISLQGAINKVSSGNALVDIFGDPIFASTGMRLDANQSDMVYMPQMCCGMDTLKYEPIPRDEL